MFKRTCFGFLSVLVAAAVATRCKPAASLQPATPGCLSFGRLVNENVMNPEEYDVLVLGSGEGSKHLAWALAKQGRRVGVVERKYVGGSCPNIACLPSK